LKGLADAAKAMSGGEYFAAFALKGFPVLLGKLQGIRFAGAKAMSNGHYLESLKYIHRLDGGIAAGGSNHYGLDTQFPGPLLGQGQHFIGISLSGLLKIDYLGFHFPFSRILLNILYGG
jgi:hypothetical protein